MGIEVHPATAARFADVATILAPKRPGSQGCWCLSYRLPLAENDALRAPHRADAVQRLCERERAPGVLAYLDGEVVGWGGIAARSELLGFSQSRFPLRADDPWIAYCFRVRAGQGKQGVTHALLAGGVAYAAACGASAVEGYPADNRGDRIDRTQASIGTLSMFERAGFSVVGDTGYRVAGHPRVIVRKELG